MISATGNFSKKNCIDRYNNGSQVQGSPFRVSSRRAQKFLACPPTGGGTNLQSFSGAPELLTRLTFEP